jgi:prolipoprotein diacylglyceryl transferase
MIWNQEPILFGTEIVTIRWYGLFFALGIGFAFLLAKKLNNVSPIKNLNIDILFNYTLLGTVVGARLGHCLFYQPDYFLYHPFEIFAVWEGGLASHGALVGVLVSTYLFSNKYQVKFLKIADFMAAPACVGGAFIRIGNFFNSEIIGNKTSLPWGITFLRIDNISRHPTQIYESVFYFLMSLFLLRKFFKLNHKKFKGQLLGYYLVGTFSFRFLIEFIKIKQVDFESSMILNMGQILSIPLILWGITLITHKRIVKTF